MAERGSGVVVNMSSMSALTPLTKVAAYGVAKTAVAALTRWLSVHLAPVIWLTTESSSFVTGVVLPIDGGFSSYSI